MSREKLGSTTPTATKTATANGALACPDDATIDEDVAGVVYACVLLLPADDDEAECPDDTIRVDVPDNPLVEACVTVLPEDTPDEPEDASANAAQATSLL